MIQHVNGYLSKNKLLTWLIGISYMSIVFFFLAMVLMTFSPRTARYAGILALVLMTLFVLGAILRNRLLVDGERISVFVLIAGFRDRFYLLLSLFFLFSLYTGLTTSGILPKLYSDNYPQAYYELVNQAETGREKPVDGKFRYEEFKKMYDQFVQRNIKEGNK
jgi:magnesium-transporting ATPase (P-type)